MLIETTILSGYPALLAARQAELLYEVGRFRVLALRNSVPNGTREIGVYNPVNQKLVLYGANMLLNSAIEAGINIGMPEQLPGTVESREPVVEGQG